MNEKLRYLPSPTTWFGLGGRFGGYYSTTHSWKWMSKSSHGEHPARATSWAGLSSLAIFLSRNKWKRPTLTPLHFVYLHTRNTTGKQPRFYLFSHGHPPSLEGTHIFRILRYRQGKGGRYLVTDSQAPNWRLNIQNHGEVPSLYTKS